MIDITGFPRTANNDLDWIQYMKYQQIIKNMSRSEEESFDELLCRKHNIRRESL